MYEVLPMTSRYSPQDQGGPDCCLWGAGPVQGRMGPFLRWPFGPLGLFEEYAEITEDISRTGFQLVSFSAIEYAGPVMTGPGQGSRHDCDHFPPADARSRSR